MAQLKNVFEKNPELGNNILLKLLARKMSVTQAVLEFSKNDIKTTNRTIQRHLKNIRENGTSKIKSIQTVISEKPILQLPPKLEKNEIIDLYKKEYEVKDYSDIPDIDPVKLLDKQLHELEMLLVNYPNDLVVQKTLIELEMKIAEKLFKMRPTSTEFNVNELLRKNDISVEFIIMIDKRFPNLDIKTSWLDFIKNQE